MSWSAAPSRKECCCSAAVRAPSGPRRHSWWMNTTSTPRFGSSTSACTRCRTEIQSGIAARRRRAPRARRRRRRHRRGPRSHLLRRGARDHPPAPPRSHAVPAHARSDLRPDDRRRVRPEARVFMGGQSGRRLPARGSPPGGARGDYAGTDLPKPNPRIKSVKCPYTGEQLATVPARNPDVTIIHAQRADAQGNTQIWGLLGVQKEAAFASERVIVVVEELVDDHALGGE